MPAVCPDFHWVKTCRAMVASNTAELSQPMIAVTIQAVSVR
jgi:hypothetical protein